MIRHGNVSRRRHEARDAGMSGGGGRRPGGQHFAPGKEVGSRWNLRGIQRGMATDGEKLGKRGNIKIQKTGEEKDGVGANLKSNIKRRSLGAEGTMSEVGITTPHNLDNLHALVASINNKILN